MRKILFILFILISLVGCKSTELYTVRTFESDWPWETIAISRNRDENIQMLLMFRNDTSFESKLIDFQKIAKNQYSSTDGQQNIEFHNAFSLVHRDGHSIIIPKIRTSPQKSTKHIVEEILEANYIVHANEHQITYFDCRKDSYCYLSKLEDHIPYDTNKWYLNEFHGELFFSYSASQRGFVRVFMENNELTFTSVTGPDEITVYNAILVKKNNNL
ncbi:MAG: hypothetical protein ABJC12_04340 [Saprospiraceae bacterium]